MAASLFVATWNSLGNLMERGGSPNQQWDQNKVWEPSPTSLFNCEVNHEWGLELRDTISRHHKEESLWEEPRKTCESKLPFWKDKSLYHTEASSFNNRHNHFDRRHLLNRSKSLILSPPAALRWQIDSQATHLILLWSWLPFHNEALCIAVSDLRKDLLGSTVEGEKVKGKAV